MEQLGLMAGHDETFARQVRDGFAAAGEVFARRLDGGAPGVAPQVGPAGGRRRPGDRFSASRRPTSLQRRLGHDGAVLGGGVRNGGRLNDRPSRGNTPTGHGVMVGDSLASRRHNRGAIATRPRPRRRQSPAVMGQTFLRVVEHAAERAVGSR